MIRKVFDYMEKNEMIEKGDRIVVGVSGGADSVCLLHVLNKYCKNKDSALTVVHINHGIRGKEADRDETYVKELCSYLSIEFFGYYYDVKNIAKEESLSEEEAGRKVRYQAFLEVCQLNKCNKIAIAHNKNDSAETILFHLFRGTGIKGLSGIEPTRILPAAFGDITLIRPLLCVERMEIEEYLHKEELSYLTDSTNLTDDYSRNKIRNRILTYVTKEINHGAIDNITEAASQLKEIEEFVTANVMERYQALVNEEPKLYRITMKSFTTEPIVIQKGILLRIMENLAGKRKDLESKHVQAILSLLYKQVGRLIHLPYGMVAEREYNDIILYCDKALQESDLKDCIKPIEVKIPGQIQIGTNGKIMETELINYKKSDPIPKSSCVKWFDYDKIENVVEIRTRKAGDYIQVNSTGGRKKLKDYFIDQKIPQKLRDSQILITDGSHVMWIPGEGERMSEKYKIDATTTRVLLMKMIDLEDDGDGK